MKKRKTGSQQAMRGRTAFFLSNQAFIALNMMSLIVLPG